MTSVEQPQDSLITLRALGDTDAGALYGLVDCNRTELRKFWWEQQTKSVADSAQFIASVNRLECENGAPTRAIQVGTRLIGVAALHSINWEFRTSLLGFWIDHEQHQKGYGMQVVQKLAALAFNELDLNELRIATRQDNIASRALAEKAGFQLHSIQAEHLWQTEEALISTATYTLDAADYAIFKNVGRVEVSP